MDINVIYHIPELFFATWKWCGTFDPRISFGVGVLASIALSRILATFESPVKAALTLVGISAITVMALLFWVSFAGVLDDGEVPFHKATETPNVDTLNEVQQ